MGGYNWATCIIIHACFPSAMSVNSDLVPYLSLSALTDRLIDDGQWPMGECETATIRHKTTHNKYNTTQTQLKPNKDSNFNASQPHSQHQPSLVMLLDRSSS
ncbi:hypothetical protein BDQ94DRAFT_144821 [Aspergillus welwitschiae]|uniref:Uncharacterized protein n=1 Tax=Aspergillus welwitschiae TaxID=1341132 RepID=A0A3F3Q0K7_9EURO|nr:hypothetical protein BDQ94DRAFT_144821 [Aspergillus welwitschiae]RDH32688.1 hypothetical protein BDQ94DRAFT_144821 [Aspergillus welwitschiae]